MVNQNDKVKAELRHHESDTGSVEVQIVDLTDKIVKLTEHAHANPKDHSSKRGLLKLVNRRKKFLDYIKSKNESLYQNIIKGLGLRK